MITRHQQIRRRTDGTVDFDRQRTLAKRATTFPSRKRHPVNTLLAVSTALAVAGALIVAFAAAAGMIHIVKVALSGAA